jgi:serine/threonine protein phosphatase 1
MAAGHKLRRWLSARQRITVDTACVPQGVRVYAIGDIHGRPDLLQQIHEKIEQDVRAAPPAERQIVVYLGDYVDRGLHSREVVDLLLDRPLPGFEAVHLRGNHDQQLLDFLANPATGAQWLRYGGDATLYSYGVRAAEGLPRAQQLQAMSEQLREVIPQRHLAFFNGLRLVYEIGDYLFVHAGIHPEKTMTEQSIEDLLWIREEFLEADFDFGKVIIHGHSVTQRPEVRDNRIGVDTGAVFSNTLTCLVLDGGTRRFLATRI